MTSRRARQTRIVRLLGRGPVASHEALRALLAAEGVEVTQATLSRDLREIGAVKGAGGYTLASSLVGAIAGGPQGSPSGAGRSGAATPMHAGAGTGLGATNGHAGGTLGTPPARGDVESVLSAVGRSAAMRVFVVSVERGGSMVVLRTGPGHASLVAAEIDRESPVGVLGTVAGDDTIFVACKGEPAARRVAAEFARAAGVATSTKEPGKSGGRSAARGGR